MEGWLSQVKHRIANPRLGQPTEVRVLYPPPFIMNNKIADITVEIHFVEHGYEMDVFLGQEEVIVVCRDFGGSYNIEELKIAGIRVVSEDLMQVFRDHIEGFLNETE